MVFRRVLNLIFLYFLLFLFFLFIHTWVTWLGLGITWEFENLRRPLPLVTSIFGSFWKPKPNIKSYTLKSVQWMNYFSSQQQIYFEQINIILRFQCQSSTRKFNSWQSCTWQWQNTVKDRSFLDDRGTILVVFAFKKIATCRT